MVTLTIAAGGVEYERRIDPEDLTLGFLEDLELAQDTGKWRDLIPAFATLLDLPREAVRQISVKQFKAIGAALQEASAVPNGSTSSSESA